MRASDLRLPVGDEVTIFEMHCEMFEQILNSPLTLFERAEDYTRLQAMLEQFKTAAPKVGEYYVYTSVSSSPAADFVSVAKFSQPRELIGIDDAAYWFDIDGVAMRYPEAGTKGLGDSFRVVYTFDDESQASEMIDWLHLNFGEWNISNKVLKENFADGKNPENQGDSARHGIPKGATMEQLKKIRSSKTASARKKQLAHWQLNMRQGKKKAKK